MTDLATVPTQVSVDPRTLEPNAVLASSTPEEVAAVIELAAAAATVVAAATPAERAGWLEALADAVVATADDLAELADRESGLGRARLDGEVVRCADQLRFYAAVAREGSWLDATIDHEGDGAPDLRRLRVPVGPVAVFGASNFPFAFGTLGHDTGSAVAAGCPVVVKGHPAHPLTHARLSEVAQAALAGAGAPEGLLGTVTGFDAGPSLVLHPAIRTVAFTGSQRGGMALWSMANARADVIPVYAEMGTVNPVVITPGAAESRSDLAAGCVASYTMGMGQFCTKPGLVMAPAGSRVGSEIVQALKTQAPRGPLLTADIAGAYVAGVDRLVVAGGTVIASVPEPGPGAGVSACVVQAAAQLLVPGSALLEECFGPVIVVVEYADADDLTRSLSTLSGCLVGSVFTAGSGDPVAPVAVDAVARIAGRVAVDAWPTGVATTWAQHHGGPWPSTSNPAATSVGSAALSRFTRPVAYQGAPAELLPPPLRDRNEWHVPRRVDGRIRLPRRS